MSTFYANPEEAARKIESLTMEEKMVLLNGITLPAAMILQKMFPEDLIINWFVDTKKEISFR